MPQVVYILCGALFTAAVATALGKLLLRGLRIDLYRQEEHVLAFLCGAPLLSLIGFAACAAGFARKSVFIGVGVAILAVAVRTGAHRGRGKELPPLGRFWKWLFGIVYGAYALLYTVNAMAPELSPDGTTYHLGLVYRYLLHHGFYRITDNMYASLSQGIEMLFLFAFSIGRHSAAALVHCTFLLVLPWLILCYGRRFGMAAAGVCGALLVFASPVAGIDGASAYNDVAVGAVAFALFYLLQIWDAERTPALFVPIGLLAGFAFAAKYTAFVAVPYALGFVVWKTWRKRQPMLSPVLVIAGCAAVCILPWMVKNWIYVQNPLSPFMNAVFPNPYIWIGFERDYAAEFRLGAYGLKSYRELPMAVAVGGQPAGVLGPIFLLAPLALMALWFPIGRQLLLAAAVFGSTYFANVGTRFLISPLPFLALAMAMAFLRVRYVAPVLVLVHAVLSWPAVVPRYSDRYAWRISGMPWRAALRIIPEEKFLSEKLGNYIITRVIERVVPSGSRVLTFAPVAEAYTSRDVPVVYESAMGKVLGTILQSPMIPEYAPTWNLSFRFPPQPLRKIRVVQTASGNPDYWTVSELRIFGRGGELERAPHWRLRAKPNPWHVQMAFDNSYMTRWSSGETIYPGMFVEVDLGRPENIERALVQCSHDQYKIRLKLEGQDAAGNWKPLAAAPEESNAPPMFNMRRAATDELKFRGIEYFLIWDSDFGAEDFRRKADAWGITVAGEGPGVRLYRIL